MENCKQFTHIPTTPTTANIYPILSFPKEKKEHKKRQGAQPSDEPRSRAPFCVYKSVDFDLCMTYTGEENLRKGKHTAYLPKSRYRRLFDRF